MQVSFIQIQNKDFQQQFSDKGQKGCVVNYLIELSLQIVVNNPFMISHLLHNTTAWFDSASFSLVWSK